MQDAHVISANVRSHQLCCGDREMGATTSSWIRSSGHIGLAIFGSWSWPWAWVFFCMVIKVKQDLE